jgi:hypothetical protein
MPLPCSEAMSPINAQVISRRSCLQIPFSMIRLACARLSRHPSARFIGEVGIASFNRKAGGASSGSQCLPKGRGRVSVPFWQGVGVDLQRH